MQNENNVQSEQEKNDELNAILQTFEDSPVDPAKSKEEINGIIIEEVKMEEPDVFTTTQATKVEEFKPQPQKHEIKFALPASREDMCKNLDNFLAANAGKTVNVADFIKSQYPFPKPGEPHKYLDRSESKFWNAKLDEYNTIGKISILSNAHLNLGMPYYKDGPTGAYDQQHVTQYHNLSTVVISAKIN